LSVVGSLVLQPDGTLTGSGSVDVAAKALTAHSLSMNTISTIRKQEVFAEARLQFIA
jgi:hypothetical protein